MEELQREGFILYHILPRREMVYILPDRSTWYCRRLNHRPPYRWKIVNRDDMDD